MSHFDEILSLVWSNMPMVLLYIAIALLIINSARIVVYEIRRWRYTQKGE